jgi:hypothetical protein
MRLISLAGLALGATACASIAPGDYVVYRIGFSDTQLGADCFDDEDPPPDIADDESTFYGGATFVVFRGAEDSFFLDIGEAMLAGSKDKGDYTFRGRSVDVYFDGDNRFQDSTEVTIVLTDDGDVVDGRSTSVDEQICSGPDCLPGYDGTCTTQTDFVGTRINDAQLEYQVPAGQWD